MSFRDWRNEQVRDRKLLPMRNRQRFEPAHLLSRLKVEREKYEGPKQFASGFERAPTTERSADQDLRGAPVP